MTLGRLEKYIPDEAAEIAFYKRLLRRSPEKVHYLDFLANAFFNQAEYIEAIHCWKKLLRKSVVKDEQRIQAKLGQAYEALGELEHAYYHFGEAIKHSPSNLEILSKYGQIAYMIDNFKDAVEAFEQICELEPDNEIALHNLALSYYNLGYHNEALQYLETSLDLNEDSAETWYAIATIYSENYLINDALNALDKALTLDPSLISDARKEESFYSLTESKLFQYMLEHAG